MLGAQPVARMCRHRVCGPHNPPFPFNQQAKHPFHQSASRLGVTRRERAVGEQMLLGGVEEQVRLVGFLYECSSGVDISFVDCTFRLPLEVPCNRVPIQLAVRQAHPRLRKRVALSVRRSPVCSPDHVLGHEPGDQGHQQASHQSLRLNPSRLPFHLLEFFLGFDLLNVFAELARASRRKSYSGLVAPLKHSGGRSGKEGEEAQSPHGIDRAGAQPS